jgi:uncharacterized OB-fold protein
MTMTFQNAVIAPDEDPDTAWWWDELRQGRLLMPRCEDAGHVFFPPSPACPHCGSSRVGRVEVSGRGRVYSWIVVHRALDPAYAGDVPYTVVTVTLDEGARVFGRIANGALEAGLPVQAVIYNVDGITLLGFERA